MALIQTITKKSVSLVIPEQWSITLNLVCTEDEDEVINQDISFDYKTGDDIDLKHEEVIAKRKKIIDKYNAEQGIYDHSKLDNLVTYLNENPEE